MHHAKTTTGAAMVVLTRDEYQALKAGAEDIGDAALLRAARNEDAGSPLLPASAVRAVLDGSLHPLTAWRKAVGLSMAELAQRANVRPASISDIENRKIDPRFGTVRALADALEVDVDNIMP